MTSKILFGLTFITYIGLAIFTLQKLNTTGERLVGWGIIAFVILAIYGLCSLLLTINITTIGGFNWISDSTSLRNIIVGILWLGLIAGVVFCTMIRLEWHSDQSTELVHRLTIPVYFGATWLPLLMLVPYAILLNSEWRETLSPTLYKLPLLAGWILGVLILLAPKIVMTLGITIPKKEIDISDTITTNILTRETSIRELLEYTSYDDERVRTEALAKIKSNKDWENELIKILDQKNKYDFKLVFGFLDNNRLEHPDLFIEPVNNTIPVMTSEIQEILKKSFLYTPDLEILYIDGVCRVLEKQFKDNSNVFRPNMQKLLEALETPPLEKSSSDEEFVQKRNTYRLAVKNWFDQH